MDRRHIDLLAPPFAGHLNPVLGMARALQPHYQVRVLTTAAAQPRVHAAGIDALPLLAGWDQAVADIVDTATPVGSNPVKLCRQVSRALRVQQQMRIELDWLYRAGRPDLVIADFTLAAAGPVAAAHGIPWWTSHPSPCVIEGGGPPCYFGGLRPMPGWLGQCRDRIGWALTRCAKRGAALLFRGGLGRVGIASLYRCDGSESVYSGQRILALGWRDLEFNSRWPSAVRFLPPFLYTPPGVHTEPRFVAGRSHVLVTMGTHLRWMKQRMANAVRRAAAATPQLEYHFSDGDPASGRRADMHDDAHAAPVNFQRLAFIDYGRHLAKYALVVHHGGSGVMHHCLAAGVPTVVHPVDYDQFDNAARLEQAGLGRRLQHLSGLSATVEAALADQDLRDRCLRFSRSHDADAGDALRAEVGAWFSARG